MTNNEFSDMFTVLLNSYNTQAQFGDQSSHQEIALDEYEKSVYLTLAQDIIVKSYFDKTLNPQGQGFDDSSRRQVDFSSLIKVATPSKITNPTTGTFDKRGIIYQMPKGGTNDILFILDEKLGVKRSNVIIKEYIVKPISYSEYSRVMSKPFGKPMKRQAWRLFQNQTSGFDILSEVIPRATLSGADEWEYKIRYVKKPQPIVLVALSGGLSVDGVSTESQCELHPSLHMDILNKAVELAIATRGNYIQATNQKQQ